MKTANEKAQELLEQFSVFIDGWRIYSASKAVCLNMMHEHLNANQERYNFWLTVFEELQKIENDAENK